MTDIRGIGVTITDKTKLQAGDLLIYTAPTDGRLVAGLVGDVNGRFITLIRGTEGPYRFRSKELADYAAKIIDPEDLISLFNNLSLRSKGREKTLKRVRDALSGIN